MFLVMEMKYDIFHYLKIDIWRIHTDTHSEREIESFPFLDFVFFLLFEIKKFQ